MGSGPSLIIVHGGLDAAQTHMKLGRLLADKFTLYIPDRRGRGLSGPFGENYGLQREVEDVEALLQKTGAHYLFGVSSGGLVILQSSLALKGIHKIAVCEPLVYLDKSDMDRFNDMVRRFDEEVSEGKYVEATVDIAKADVPSLQRVPRFLLEMFFALVYVIDDIRSKGNDVRLTALLPTLKFDVQLVNETEGRLEDFRKVPAEVLLLGGSKSESLLKESLDALSSVLPHVHRIELPGLDHKAAANGGKPERIAEELLKFFV
jgi:pimeloyl-ACP methyl ester carboxylesterase